MIPGQKRKDGLGNFYVFDSRQGDKVKVHDLQKRFGDDVIAIPLSRWEMWDVVVEAKQEGLF